jgi:hypothetical protein
MTPAFAFGIIDIGIGNIDHQNIGTAEKAWHFHKTSDSY